MEAFLLSDKVEIQQAVYTVEPVKRRARKPMAANSDDEIDSEDEIEENKDYSDDSTADSDQEDENDHLSDESNNENNNVDNCTDKHHREGKPKEGLRRLLPNYYRRPFLQIYQKLV
ncbi:unnamed protein product [Hymenolepis diminuta]|uniref:Uncharacterized protein n=1 Tax=Hymenolepis diminuta TaxID=6216 RepID=A0A564Y597_HYMDI|nr:unnamed protein product [Hymenolepis diminuta]